MTTYLTKNAVMVQKSVSVLLLSFCFQTKTYKIYIYWKTIKMFQGNTEFWALPLSNLISFFPHSFWESNELMKKRFRDKSCEQMHWEFEVQKRGRTFCRHFCDLEFLTNWIWGGKTRVSEWVYHLKKSQQKRETLCYARVHSARHQSTLLHWSYYFAQMFCFYLPSRNKIFVSSLFCFFPKS